MKNATSLAMRFLASSLLVGAVTTLATAASAQSPADAPVAVSVSPAAAPVEAPRATSGDRSRAAGYPATVFFGMTAGIGAINASHPEIGKGSFVGPLLGMQVGYAFSPRWSASLQMTDLNGRVSRLYDGQLFDSTSTWMQPQAGCNGCKPKPPGGAVLSTDVHFSTITPRVDFSPLGVHGPYLAVAAGLAFFNGLEPHTGGTGQATIGFRYRIAKGSTIQLEGGVQGQEYGDDTSAAMYFGALSGNLHL